MHVDVLSRGYGRRSALPLLVSPSGTTEDFGDEPLVIAREALVPVYVSGERYEAGSMAEANAAREQGSKGAREQIGVHLLDDGFQHRQLARAVDILLLSRRDMNDYLLPAGNLREALHAAERAQVIAISADEPDVEAEIKSRGWKAKVWRLRRHMEVPPLQGPVAAFCGIAHPGQFFEGLESAGVRLAARIAFGDHHRYSETDLKRVVTAAHTAAATTLLTTEKDRVRLGSLAENFSTSVSIRTVPLRIGIENEAEGIDELVRRIRATD
jgi:tetraacyldisaccharide 4'-kinase